MKKSLSIALIVTTCLFISQPVLWAKGGESLTRGAASLLVPGLGQYINGELETRGGKVKTGAMIVIEAGAIVTTAVVGGIAGYPQIWTGLGIFILNHIWSATDAYVNAPAGPEVSLKENIISDR
ncbi:MAG: hypothetical protein COV74_08495 [Candidatus Omnitrophica bacterium CG11_big_fil_rev_8_21_14_0_20_45_26]|uniref:DUF5683 domain-containing protein n=1 Tax=Candidatus Abzuiibacterium crystallinum TaxID=1974748 RepID=A0A2H0LM60_9BACT|nr:MAG: hypothetical protein COV74_08495 [Candidatus Omnitrophica bacterium CG11_big_fil_rev_8_21_14_0_20_45_26]PIW63700.1 MAG: hypothetical protein COW12_09380 [Candidatus Omnitrophica bacterium CG12_big_fil_rev_8_21_14_0_65_45_16]